MGRFVPGAAMYVRVHSRAFAKEQRSDWYSHVSDFFHGDYAARMLDEDLFQERREHSASLTTRAKQDRTNESGMHLQFFFDLLPAGFPTPPHPSHDLGCRVALSAGRLQLNQFVLRSMYLLSNNLHDHRDGDKGLEVFCSILERDARHTIKLLHRRLPSIQSAWISLLGYSLRNHRRDTFQILIDAGIRNAWLDLLPPCGGFSLVCDAVNMDCNDTVMDLVTHGSRPGGPDFEILGAIIAAMRKGNDECARLLIMHCDLMAYRDDAVWTFENMIFMAGAWNDGDIRAMEFLLTIGAHVDQPIRLEKIRRLMNWDDSIEIDDSTRLTILDFCFYLDRPLYEKLAPYSEKSESDVSRAGVLLALKGGTTALENYLVERVTATTSELLESYLELILAEQFILQWTYIGGEPIRGYRDIDLETVRGLIQYGVNLALPALPSINIGIQDLLRAVLHQLSRHCTDDGLKLISILIAKGARIEGPQLRMVVEEHGFNILECLALLVEDFPAKAALALAEAARLDNFGAVDFLLRSGVNPNSFVPGGEIEDTPMATGGPFEDKSMKHPSHSSYSVQAIAAAAAAVLPRRERSASCDMIKHLAEQGARLVVTPNDSSPFDFVRHLLRHSTFDTFRKVKYAIQVLGECKLLSALPPYLLELCVNLPDLDPDYKREDWKGRLEMFEYLLGQGAPVKPGSCLAALICAGGSEQLVEKVVRSGADLNAYHLDYTSRFHGKCTPLQAAAINGNERLVRLLLEAGSDVNSRACIGLNSKTALQAICSWDTATEEEYERKMRICQLIISHGADVNAAPARVNGWTALQFAAMAGHLEIAALLLRNRARINAPSCGVYPHMCTPSGLKNNALDAAVRLQRLDMVKFLLNANALSSCRGTTGYDGAIEIAEHEENFVIAELIRDHVANNMAQGLINPELSIPQEDYHIYGYTTDKYYGLFGRIWAAQHDWDICRYTTTDFESNFLWEDCTTDSLCSYCSGIDPDQVRGYAGTVGNPL